MSPGPDPAELGDGVGDGVELVAVGIGVGVVGVDDGPVADVDGVGAAGDLDDRRAEPKCVGEALGVDGGRGDDDLEVGAAGEQLGEVAEDEVDVEAAFVGLVDDQGVVAAEHPVARELGQQDAVGHELDQRVLADLVGEAHLPADGVADLGVQLLGDAGGDGARGEAAGLGVPDHPAHAAAQLEADLGDLGGLPGAGLARDDHDLVVADGGGDVVAARADGELGRVGDRGEGGAAVGDGVLGGVDGARRRPASAFSRAWPSRARAAVARRRAMRCSSARVRAGRRSASAATSPVASVNVGVGPSSAGRRSLRRGALAPPGRGGPCACVRPPGWIASAGLRWAAGRRPPGRSGRGPAVFADPSGTAPASRLPCGAETVCEVGSPAVRRGRRRGRPVRAPGRRIAVPRGRRGAASLSSVPGVRPGGGWG